MILTHQNIRGGKKVTGFPIREQDGLLGYFLGYCPGCNESVLMSMRDRDILIATFHCEEKTIKKIKELIKPKISLMDSLLKKLAEWINKHLSNPSLVDNI